MIKTTSDVNGGLYMSMKIEISQQTYSRLESLAKGFDTPEAVIVRLMDLAEGRSETKPKLTFYPNDEQLFKKELIDVKEAEVVLYKTDGSREITRWKANKISDSSNLRGNLWSGFLRGWKDKGIKSAEFTILPKGLNTPDDDTELRKAIALELGLKFDELSQLEFELSENTSDDGLVYSHILQFDENCNEEILSKIDGLHENRWIYVNSL